MITRSDPRLIAWFQRFSRFASSIVILIPCLVLVGWTFDVEVLKRIHPSLVAMNPVTAVNFILCGLALWVLRDAQPPQPMRRMVQVFAGFVVMVGLLRIVAITTGWDLGADQILFRSKLDSGPPPPNRIAPNTALNFVLIGLALLLVDTEWRKRIRPFQALALAVAWMALLAIIGYLYGATSFYKVKAYIPMAVHTAVTFIFLAAGLLGTRPDWGLMARVTSEHAGGIMVRRMLVVVMSVPLLLGALLVVAQRAELYDPTFRFAIYVVLIMMVFSGMIWGNAISLDRKEAERDRATEALRQANTALQAEVAERQRAEAAAQEAREVAETATRVKSEFLANMSHELRTPLNAIIGFSEILEDQTFGEMNKRQARYVTNILTSGRHLLQLINDILDLAKIEAGRLELAVETFEVPAALQDVANIVKTLANKKNIILTVDLPPHLPPLTADQPKFKQIMYNLLSNAIKFTPDGGTVAVTARLEGESGRVGDSAENGGREQEETRRRGDGETSRQGDNVSSATLSHSRTPPLSSSPTLSIAVSDTGIGIKPEDRERVFGEFEQVDSSYARQQQGTGLGLALTKRLVELHGGRIWVESEGIAGKGTSFIFELPLVARQPEAEVAPPESEAAPSEAADSPALPSANDSASLRPLVLVVEDNRHASELLTHYLQEAGYQVAHAYDGEQALHMVRDLKPSAITLDVMLPKKDGMQVLAELKAMPEHAHIPVIIVSMTEDQQLGFSLGAVDYLIKPVDRNQLIGAVRRAGAMTGKQTLSVLVVDDEPKTVEMLSDLLRHQGHRPLPASGGQQAIDLALAHLPDLIILDLMMPNVTGFDVVRRLREHEAAREIPILIYTAKDITDEDRQRLRSHNLGIVAKSGKEDLLRELEKATRANHVERRG